MSAKCDSYDYRQLNEATIVNNTYSNASVPIEFTTKPNCKYILVGVKSDSTNAGDEVWIDEVDVGVSERKGYVPYDAQTANIPYTLHSIGDVVDTFNPLTGEYVQRVGRYIVTGDEDIVKRGQSDTGYLYMMSNVVTDYDSHNANLKAICSHYNFVRTYNGSAYAMMKMQLNEVSIYANSETNLWIIYFNVNYEGAADFKAYLKEQFAKGTPVTILYELKNPVATTLAPTDLHANIPNTNIWFDEPNDLGSIKTVLQTKE